MRVRGGGGDGREGLAVLTQGSAHTRRSVATTGVLLFKGGAVAAARVEQSELKGRFGGPHTRRCIHKAVHTQGGAHTRRCTHRRYVATTGVLLFRGVAVAGPSVKRSEPSVERSEPKGTGGGGTGREGTGGGGRGERTGGGDTGGGGGLRADYQDTHVGNCQSKTKAQERRFERTTQEL